MSLLNNLRIFTKLMGAFGVVLVLFLATGVYALMQMSTMNDSANELADNWMVAVDSAQTLDSLIGDFRRFELEHIISDSAKEMANNEKRMDELFARLGTVTATFEALLALPEEKALFERYQNAWDDYQVEHEKLLEIS